MTVLGYRSLVLVIINGQVLTNISNKRYLLHGYNFYACVTQAIFHVVLWMFCFRTENPDVKIVTRVRGVGEYDLLNIFTHSYT